jgi:hypothetical protein
VIEVWVWLALSLIGTAVSGYLTRQSLDDLRSLRPDSNGRRSVARSRLAREGLRVTVHLGYIAAALGALHLVEAFRPLIVPFLMYGNVVLVANSVIDARTRHLLYDSRETAVEREDREAGVVRRGH